MDVAQVDQFGSEGFSDGLFSEADSEDALGGCIASDEGEQDAGFLGYAGAGGEEDSVEAFYFVERDAVVAMYFHRFSQFPEDVEQIVGEGIVVV
jgi:hypothetical protein